MPNNQENTRQPVIFTAKYPHIQRRLFRSIYPLLIKRTYGPISLKTLKKILKENIQHTLKRVDVFLIKDKTCEKQRFNLSGQYEPEENFIALNIHHNPMDKAILFDIDGIEYFINELILVLGHEMVHRRQSRKLYNNWVCDIFHTRSENKRYYSELCEIEAYGFSVASELMLFCKDISKATELLKRPEKITKKHSYFFHRYKSIFGINSLQVELLIRSTKHFLSQYK